ncbi:palmitoyltransferase ZDHHC6-like [Artemia franciscana]|uniref:Palmitoyltransferase n=1 Tax=Artemia franciscana TaxID=6661 RepID=A0AA88I5G1_ARTSF|nr:hypothetical protein QYM36_004207 [Artemia franciscana]
MSILKQFSRIFHWGPLIALGIIKSITFTTLRYNEKWWPFDGTLPAILNLVLFVISSSLTLYHFLASLALGPGYVPLHWKPVSQNDISFLQFCSICKAYKAPRSHHCSKCGKCVLKMDHHCPWINNCVGHYNHGHFTAFLAFAVIGCSHATIILLSYLMMILFQPWQYHYPSSRGYIGTWHIFWIVINIGLAIGVVIAVGILLFLQLRAILRNRTGIEDWILEKAVARRKESQDAFVYPYDLGRMANWNQVVNFSCTPIGDGIFWTTKEGCNEYTLTIEQIEQKRLKKLRSIEYEVIRSYSGSWFPVSHGLRAVFCQPCTEEPRIYINLGEIITVTRWKKYWYYGEVFQFPRDTENGRRRRGWFPKRCVQVLDSAPGPVKEFKKKK